jgi:anti-anti-sigma regulatory factor
MHFEREQSGSAVVLKLKGRCTIEHANEMKAVLADALRTQEQVVVTLDGASDFDLSFLQLLCSAHGTSLQRNKLFALGGILPDAFRQAVEEAGYGGPAGCRHDPLTGCPWKGGKE